MNVFSELKNNKFYNFNTFRITLFLKFFTIQSMFFSIISFKIQSVTLRNIKILN